MDPDMKKFLLPAFARIPVPDVGRSSSVNAKRDPSRTPRSRVTRVPFFVEMGSVPE
jgi:hypothetical protein